MLAVGIAPTSGGTTSRALRFLAGEASDGLAGELAYATTREPLGVASGALVVWGPAGRGFSVARVSNGWSGGEEGGNERRPTPEGVGVKGGGLVGGSEGAFAFALRFLGRGVEGRSGIVKAGFEVEGDLVSSDVACAGDVADTLLLRFLGTAAGFVTFSYFAIPSSTATSGVEILLLLATRAERLGDMLNDRVVWLGDECA